MKDHKTKNDHIPQLRIFSRENQKPSENCYLQEKTWHYLHRHCIHNMLELAQNHFQTIDMR